MKKLLKDNSGAVSVLIVMTMIVVVTFGLLALNSALYNHRLSLRSLDTMSTHYTLDYSGEALVSEFDAALYESEQEVLAYFAQGGYLNASSGVFSGEVARQIQVGYAQRTTDTDKMSYLQDSYYRLYLYNAMQKLLAMQQEDPSITVLLWNEPQALPENLLAVPMEQVKNEYTLMVGCTLTDNQTESESLLDVLIRVQVPEFKWSSASVDRVSAEREVAVPRYSVVAWREYKQSDMPSDVQYWDGKTLLPTE